MDGDAPPSGSFAQVHPDDHALAAEDPGTLQATHRKADRRRLLEVIRPKTPRMAARLVNEIFGALDEQTVVVPGTGTLDVVVPSLARSLAAVHEQRRALEARDCKSFGVTPDQGRCADDQ